MFRQTVPLREILPMPGADFQILNVYMKRIQSAAIWHKSRQIMGNKDMRASKKYCRPSRHTISIQKALADISATLLLIGFLFYLFN